jgi:methyl-accepting chemotaxis protein
MLKKTAIRGKFISIITVVTLVLLAAMALAIITTANKSQSQQTNAFIDLLNAEQGNEKELLNRGLLQKGESMAALLAQTASSLIIGYDFDTLQQVAGNGANDPDISFVAFYDKDEKSITKHANQPKDIKTIKQTITFEKEVVGFVEVGLNFDSVNKSMGEVKARIMKMTDDTRTANAKASQVIINLIVVSSIACLVVLCLLIYWTVTRVIIKPVNRIIEGLIRGADQVASASDQISSTSQSLAEGSSEQAASIEETSSSLEEMSSMTKQNADNANQADNLMKEANRVVTKANDSMADLTVSMEEISKASQETSKIIKTIDEIAFQTNLLALNAAVEAARAGEAGAGFAVVADEVRNLAMRAADAAKNTAELIEGTVQKVKDGGELVATTNDAFGQVADSAAKVGELVGEIAAASKEQAQGIGQVNTAVTEMDKIVQQNAANAEESASASEEMNAQAEQMKGFVEDLEALVGGNAKSKTKRGHTRVKAPKALTGKAFAAPVKKEVLAHNAKEIDPDQVIPMHDEDFAEF